MSSSLPNFIIAGAPKSGTSTLHRWLADHPEVYGAKEKETFYFLDEDSHAFDPACTYLRQGLEGYRQFFDADAAQQAKVVVESTPAYIYSATARTHLSAIETKPTFLFLLREPVSQLRSVHTYFSNTFQHIPADMGFAGFVEAAKRQDQALAQNELCQRAIDYASYVKWLDLWQAEIGKDRMMVHLFEDMIADPQAYMKQLAATLGIDPGFYDSYDFPKENESYRVKSSALQAINVRVRAMIPRNSGLYRGLRSLYRKLNTESGKAVLNQDDEQAASALKAYFAPLNEQLAQHYGLDLARWR